MRRVRVLGFVTIASAVLLTACQWVLGIDTIDGETRPDATAIDATVATDAGAADAGVAPFMCAFPPVGVPAPPSVTYDAGATTPLVFAIQTLSSANGAGINLDCRDTVSVEAGVVDLPCATSPPDQEGGVDDEYLAALGKVVPVTADFFDQVYAALTAGGATTLLLVVQGLGLGGAFPTEGNLPLPVYLTSSAAGLSAVGCPATYIRGFCDDGGNTCETDAQADGPRWDGCDTWSSVTNPRVGASATANNLGFSNTTYLNNGMLVLRFDALSIALNSGGLDLEDVVVTAQPSTTVTDAGATIAVLDGQMAGRVRAEDLMSIAARYKVSGVTPLCKTPLLSDTQKEKLCALRDLPSFDIAHPELRGGSPSAACTRVSIAFAFHAVQAQILPSGLTVPYTDPCDGTFDASCP